MESTPTIPGLGESPLNKPESSNDKEKKDKKDTKRLPINSLFADAVQKKPDHSLTELFKPPVLETDSEPKASSISESKSKDEADKLVPRPQLEIADHPDVATITESLSAEAEPHFLTPEEAWARLEREQTPKPKEEATSLPMNGEGEIELFNASEVHQRLQFPKAEAEAEPPAEPPRPEATPVEAKQASAPENSSETPPEPPKQSTEGGGRGGNFEPPSGQEQPAGNPEPDRPNRPLTAPWQAQAEQQHQARLTDALSPSDLPPPVAVLPETRIIERDRGGGALALLVGAVDYFGRRRLRRELRRGQKRQDKQLKALKQRQLKDGQAYQRQLSEQQAALQREHQHVTGLTDRVNHSEGHARQLETQQAEQQRRLSGEQRRAVPGTRIETVSPPLRAAMAETAIEQTLQLPTDHHMEHSTWHNIEVDKTGRAVERPVLAYGQEFQREQHQETRYDDIRAAAGATGQLAVTGTAATDATAQQPTVPPPSRQVAPNVLENTVRERPTRSLQTTVLSPWFLIAAIIIFFAIVSAVIVH